MPFSNDLSSAVAPELSSEWEAVKVQRHSLDDLSLVLAVGDVGRRARCSAVAGHRDGGGRE